MGRALKKRRSEARRRPSQQPARDLIEAITAQIREAERAERTTRRGLARHNREMDGAEPKKKPPRP